MGCGRVYVYGSAVLPRLSKLAQHTSRFAACPRACAPSGMRYSHDATHQSGTPSSQLQQHDPHEMLGLVLGNLNAREEQNCARSLHPVSRGSRSTAVSTLKHLSFARYNTGRTCALEAVLYAEPHSITPAAARAAAAPYIPRLLVDVARAGTLTSLEVTAPQAHHLLVEGPPAAAAAAAAATPGLAAMLAGLRSLKVVDMTDDAADLQQVGRLVGSCSSVSRLTLEAAEYVTESTPLLTAMEDAAAAAAAAASTAAAGAGLPRGTRRGSVLPALRHLELVKPMPGLLVNFIDLVAAPQLQTLVLSDGAVRGSDLACLADCPRLCDLELRGDTYDWAPVPSREVVLPHQLTQLGSLTRLVVTGLACDEQVLPMTWRLSELRCLELKGCHLQPYPQDILPDISSLRHLTLLILPNSVRDATGELGRCLPQLERLEWEFMYPHNAKPQHLEQLIGLRSLVCSLNRIGWRHPWLSVADVCEHAGRLQELRVGMNWPLLPPFGGFSRLTALQVLSIALDTEAAVVTPSPLPCLRWLDLSAQDAVRVASQLLGAARHLTFLQLRFWGGSSSSSDSDSSSSSNSGSTSCGSTSSGSSSSSSSRGSQVRPENASLAVLGVLPMLKELNLQWHGCCLLGAGPWLQQQPQLTSLVLSWYGEEEVLLQLGPLPCQLERLCLHAHYGVDVSEDVMPGGLPPSLSQLTRLHTVGLYTGSSQLPPWVPNLSRLQVLSADGPQLTDNWEVLRRLPLLRHLHTDADAPLAPLLREAPHLLWAKRSRVQWFQSQPACVTG